MIFFLFSKLFYIPSSKETNKTQGYNFFPHGLCQIPLYICNTFISSYIQVYDAYPTICSFVHTSIHPSIYLSIPLSIHLPIQLIASLTCVILGFNCTCL